MKIKRLINGEGRVSEIIRFGLVGGFATLLQYGLYVVFADAVGLTAVMATMVSYAISFIFNFVLSNLFTFHTRPNARKGLGFLASHLINMGLQVGLVAIFNIFLNKTLALLPAMAICVPVNYLLVRFSLTNRRFQSRKDCQPSAIQDIASDMIPPKSSGTFWQHTLPPEGSSTDNYRNPLP